ncbi:hypothetical protein LguiA_026524 [Lonicera macranthoides]
MAAGSQRFKYDVFFSSSDHYDDKVFTNSIYEALDEAGFRVYRNKDESEVAPVEMSRMAIIFLSKNYVSSKSCLDELVMILKSKIIFGQLVYPIFCGVYPSELEEQMRSFSEPTSSFGKDEEAQNKIKEWREALRQANRFPFPAVLKQEDIVNKTWFLKTTIHEIKDRLRRPLPLVLPVTTKGYIPRASSIEEIEAASIQIVELVSNSEKLLLQSISNATDIPFKYLRHKYVLGVLDLSNSSIGSLMETIAGLVELRQLLLRDVELLIELPSKIGALKNLKVLDLERTDLICLPEEIGELRQLECLKVSLYRCADSYIGKRKGIQAIIPRGALSKLSQLKELEINVDPDCEWWDVVVEAIINELSALRNLKILKLYFPTDELLQQFLQLPGNVYTSLSNFRLIVGRHEPDIIFCVPNDLQIEFEKSEKCLKCVNGEGNTVGIGKALEHAKALLLDRHWTIEKLSEFKIHEMHLLVRCLIVECNEMNTIIDGSDFYQGDEDNNEKPVLELLRYLSIHHMKNLQCIWKGPIVKGCLSSLQILALYLCPKLITIFNPALLRNLVNLKDLIVKNCPKIESLVTVEPHPFQSDGDFLPNLQNIVLVHLPGLLSISGGLIILPNLQRIVVYNCPKLNREDQYSRYIREINNDSNWSNELYSSYNETDYLQSIFGNLDQSGNSPQAARTEGILHVPKEDKTEQEKKKKMMKTVLALRGVTIKALGGGGGEIIGVAPYEHGMDRLTDNATILSICGVAGIGKTTIAMSVYNSNYDKFEASCYLSNIRQYSRKPNGLFRLAGKLLSSIRGKQETNIHTVDQIIHLFESVVPCRRVLIVLDDVDDLSQLQALLGKRVHFHPDSKIIITTENQWLLKGYEDHKLYVVERLNDDESLRLFNLHAFGRDHPNTGYEDLSMKLVKHCDGIPLALVVLGSSLYGRSLSEFESVNDKMELIPQTRQLDWLLKRSFHSLPDQHDKDLFLHIACFFIGKHRDYVTAILDGCGFQAATGIRTLENRCLLTIDRDNKLRMHQLLQDMRREIVLQEESAGKRRRVWQHEDALDVLRERGGGDKIEGLVLEFPTAQEPLIYETDAFSRMEKLRLLQLNNVQLTGGYEEFPKDLVWLCWRGFPLSSLPTDFPMEKLVVLDVRYSSLKQVWEKTKFLSSLKILNLSHSRELTCAPDFSMLPKLESLILKDCVNLLEVHESIVYLERLCLLNLKGCINLRKLPRLLFIRISLNTLVLSGCSELLKQPKLKGELESLKNCNSQLCICVEEFEHRECSHFQYRYKD